MTEVALGPAAAFSVFVIAVVVFVTSMLNVLLQRLTAPSLRVRRIGA
jgi:iron(III) transport system permease protein